MGLFGRSKRKEIPKEEFTVRISAEPLDRLTPEGELPLGWLYANKGFIDRITSEYKYFLDTWLDIRNKDVVKEYGAVKSLVIYLENAKKLCSSKGECFAKWFDDIIANQEFIDKHKARQKYIEDNIDDLLKEEKRKKEIEEVVMPELKGTLIEIIKNEPNIIQSELYKRFASDLKSHISSELYYMEKDGLVCREKSGKSYKLTIKA